MQSTLHISASTNPFDQLRSFNAWELMKMDLDPPAFIVDDILPEGTTILASRPKLGKTLLVQNLGLAIASGGQALGSLDAESGRVLYLALEGGTAGIQARIRKMLRGQPAPDRFDIFREWPQLKPKGLALLRRYIKEHPDTKLIIIDTLARVRNSTSPNRSVYEVDYQALQPLSQIYMDTGVSIVVVHHTNKRDGHLSDPMDLVSGSTGLTGAVDNVIVMAPSRRAAYGQNDVTLHLMAREMESSEHELELDTKTATWQLLGAPVSLAKTPERQEILDLIRQEGRLMKPSEIALLLTKKGDTVRYLVRQMLDAGDLVQPKHGLYDLPPTVAP